MIPAPTNVIGLALPEPTKPDLPYLPDYGKKGTPLKTSANLWAILNHYGWETSYNLMTAEPELRTSEGSRLGGTDEGQHSALVDACQRSEVPDKAIGEHLPALCQYRSYHPVREWLEAGSRWDGVPRLAAALATLNATDPAYAAAVLRPWLVGCVAALYEEQWLSKLVPVLVGGQSFRKSAWVNRLAAVVDDATLDCSINPGKTDDVRRAVTAWIVELAELETTTKNEAGALKAFITRDVDRFRVTYAARFTKKKRQTSFIATVNGTGFLKDQTGNARFAVIEMAEAANLDRLNELLGWRWDAGRLRQIDAEQLRQFWLEVKAAYEAGESWFLDEATSNQAAKANDTHTDKGPHYETIVDRHLARPMQSARWFTAADLCERHGEKPAMASRYGRALTMLEKEGRIELRPARSGRKEYRLPVNDLPQPQE
ncbi:VapE domain-containing protein [Aeromonas rivipollensis]|uniref:VapE domain-containing protein n=1 Tax=Aeromonas rivipollensis TaxID=948519 RepID=UPI00259E2711|nr:VapE domain-containing protein [Aeromonas rivipollensis]MDM5122015.1 virulence-associated E family protein [Aeromonas rivipollensis]